MVPAILTKTFLITLVFLYFVPCPSGQSILSMGDVMRSVCCDPELKPLTIDETCVTERCTELKCAAESGGRRDPPSREPSEMSVPSASPSMSPQARTMTVPVYNPDIYDEMMKEIKKSKLKTIKSKPKRMPFPSVAPAVSGNVTEGNRRIRYPGITSSPVGSPNPQVDRVFIGFKARYEREYEDYVLSWSRYMFGIRAAGKVFNISNTLAFIIDARNAEQARQIAARATYGRGFHFFFTWIPVMRAQSWFGQNRIYDTYHREYWVLHLEDLGTEYGSR